MGLSNEERFAKIAFGINRINSKWEDTKEKIYKDNISIWQPLVNGFWPAFLNSKAGAGGFNWFLGTTMLTENASRLYLPHLAMIHTTEDKSKYLDSLNNHEAQQKRIKELEAVGDKQTLEKYKNWVEFSRVHELAKNKGSIPFNLHHSDTQHEESWVMTLWVELEYLQYAINRYDDEFEKKLKPLSDHIAQVIGVCFDKMQRSPDFAASYLLHQIWNAVITSDDEDPLNKLIVTKYLYHQLQCASKYDVQHLKNTWTRIQFTKPTLETRLFLCIDLLAPKLDIPNAADIFNTVKRWNIKNKKQVLKKLDILLEQAVKDKKQKTQDTTERYWKQKYCELTEKSAHNLPYPFAQKPKLKDKKIKK